MLTGKQFVDAVARRLKTASKIEVRYKEGLDPVPVAERDKLAARLAAYLGPALSKEMLRRLSFPRHFKLYWEYPAADEPDIFNGEVSLYNLADSLMEKDFSFLNYAEKPELAFLDTYRILDEHPYIGDGNMTVIALNDDFTDVGLHYLSEYKLYKLKLSFEEYHQCLAATLGYTHWQFLFCEGLDASTHEHMQTTYRAKLSKDLRMLWPGEDLGEFFALVDRAG
ncbi:MAG: hypothetical protein ACJ74T_14985 [Pyrinomonadaceae bacterium]